jgi:hypothetical protein
MGEGQAFILESLRKGDKTPGGNLPFGFRQASLQPFPPGFKYPAARCFRGTSRPTGYSLGSLERHDPAPNPRDYVFLYAKIICI